MLFLLLSVGNESKIALMGERPSDAVLLREIADGVAVLRLNRPRQYNALSAELLAALHEALDSCAADESVRVVLIAASGNAFCAGHDLKEMRALSAPEGIAGLFTTCSLMMQKIAALPQPVIAVVNGLATAAGCQLVAQCDLAVASEHARFAVSGINLGLFCSTPSVPLARNISRKRAAEMLFTGEFIDAPTALDWGLVNRVAPADRLMETARELANNLKSKPREALALGKALLYRQLEAPTSAAYEDASRTIAANMDAEFAREGVDAFLEKRPPRW
jgi:enoyl-CoA hydratase/carnithine racemase